MAAESSRGASPGGLARTALVVVTTAAVYAAAAEVGFSLASWAVRVSPVWPATGIALAATVLFGAGRAWLGIAIGAFVTNLTKHEPVGTALAIATGNTLEAVVGASLLARVGVRPALARLRDALGLVILVAAASTTLSATIGVVALCAGGVDPWDVAGRLWWTWWVGDALGALVVAPVLLVWLTPQPAPPARVRRFEATALTLASLVAGGAVFLVHQKAPLAVYPLHYTMFPLVIMAALRLGQRGTATVTFLVSVLAIWGTVAGAGPFAAMPTRHESLVMVQLFTAVIAVTGLVLGAAIEERDLSRRRRARDFETLEQSEERLRLALDAGRMGVWDWNLVTNEVGWSENLEAIHGLAPGSFGGTFESFQELIHPDDREHVRRAIDEAVESRTGYQTDFRNVRDDGSVGWMSAIGRVFSDGAGRAVRMIGVGMDVTERRRLAEELEVRAHELATTDRRKDEFLAMLAHELRNPLAPLSAALSLLREPASDRDRVLAIADRQMQQLARLVDDLLDASRITQGKIALRAEPVWLADVVGRAIESAKPAIEARGQVFRVDLPPEPVRLHADPARLAQVIANLLDNAAKYTPDGGFVGLSAERDRDEIVLHVRDTGAGLAPELLPNVFDLFVQGDRSLDRPHGGLGIGLTIVRRLVELHGGRVEARSAGAGMGSEFVVRLPALPALADATLAPRDAPAPSGPPTTGLKVLVVEDNRDAAEVLATVVGLWGHEVRTAFDAPAALHMLDGWKPDVILSDLGLPRMDGYELARRLREPSARCGAVLIALSGYGREEDKRATRDAGFDHHFVKPPDLQLLAGLLEQIAAGLGDDAAARGGN
jgi:two-component system CheB/CheR fusion protein